MGIRIILPPPAHFICDSSINFDNLLSKDYNTDWFLVWINCCGDPKHKQKGK